MISQQCLDQLNQSVINQRDIISGDLYLGEIYQLDSSLIIVRVAWNNIYWHQTPDREFVDACKRTVGTFNIDISEYHVLADCVMHEAMSAHFVDECALALRKCFDADQKITVVYNNCAFELFEQHPQLHNVTFVGINFFAVLMYYHYINEKFQWGYTDRALLLLGQPYKYHRLPLLYQCWKQGLIENLVYSFSPVPFINNEQILEDNWIQEGIQLLSNNTTDNLEQFDYESWALSIANTLDRPFEKHSEGVSNNFNGTDVPVDLYTQSCIEIIPETHYEQPWFFTEKTYRPLMLGFPFIHVGYHFSQCLKALGYRTYECYADDHSVCEHTDDYHHTDQIPKTVTFVDKFLHSAQQHQSQIAEQVHSNKQLVVGIAKQQIAKLEKILGENCPAVAVFFIRNK